jgi:parallel beta-helix repeat protein
VQAAFGPIHIRADGSIDPSGTPILTADNATYAFTDNVYAAAIIVERDNIVIDGNDFMLNGNRSAGWIGFDISVRSNVTIKNTEILNFGEGVHLENSSKNTLARNYITGMYRGIYCEHSSNNTISENSITANSDSIDLLDSSNGNFIFGNYIANSRLYGLQFEYTSSTNKIYHNSFFNNSVQANCWLTNTWDDGYPSGGNYWSDYNGTDANHDGIGDSNYTIYANNSDRYPLMAPISFFDAGTWNSMTYYVNIVSNSTLSHFHFNPDEGAFVSFWVKGETETEAFDFCRVAIPKDLLWVEDGWTVLYGSYPLDYETFSDENYTYLYFNYTNPLSSGFTTVTINGTNAIPEFPSLLIFPLFMSLTLCAAIAYRKKRQKLG